MITELGESTMNGRRIKLRQVSGVINKANSVMVVILNKNEKFEDREKLMAMKV